MNAPHPIDAAMPARPAPERTPSDGAIYYAASVRANPEAHAEIDRHIEEVARHCQGHVARQEQDEPRLLCPCGWSGTPDETADDGPSHAMCCPVCGGGNLRRDEKGGAA